MVPRPDRIVQSQRQLNLLEKGHGVLHRTNHTIGLAMSEMYRPGRSTGTRAYREIPPIIEHRSRLDEDQVFAMTRSTPQFDNILGNDPEGGITDPAMNSLNKTDVEEAMMQVGIGEKGLIAVLRNRMLQAIRGDHRMEHGKNRTRHHQTGSQVRQGHLVDIGIPLQPDLVKILRM